MIEVFELVAEGDVVDLRDNSNGGNHLKMPVTRGAIDVCGCRLIGGKYGNSRRNIVLAEPVCGI
jgi:hypothetical protein